MRQAVNDTVEDLRRQPFEYVQRLDATLHEHGFITFSEIRRRYSSSYKRILKRGNLKIEAEYYIITGIIADLESGISEGERNLIEQLAMQYEKKPYKRCSTVKLYTSGNRINRQ